MFEKQIKRTPNIYEKIGQDGEIFHPSPSWTGVFIFRFSFFFSRSSDFIEASRGREILKSDSVKSIQYYSFVSLLVTPSIDEAALDAVRDLPDLLGSGHLCWHSVLHLFVSLFFARTCWEYVEKKLKKKFVHNFEDLLAIGV